MQLIFEPPTRETPGFLRRMKQALAFQDAINKNQLTEQVLDNLVDFLSTFIKNVSQGEARELLFDASEVQFMDMLSSITNTEQPDDTKKNGNK